MKKPNDHLTRLVVWCVTGSILTSSCVNMVPEPSNMDNVLQIHDMGMPAIHVNLTAQQSGYYNYVSELAHRILSDREFAKEFNRAPEKYLKATRSIDIDVDVADDELMRITTALADDDIAEAIANKDIKQYLRLMHSKGLLNNTANDYANLLTVDEKKQLLRSLGITDISDKEIQSVAIAAVVCLFYVAVIAVSHASIAYTAVAAVNVSIALSVVFKTAAATKTKVSGHTHLEISDNFDVYILSSNNERKEIYFDDVEMTKAIDDAVEVYRELYVKEAKSIDTNKLKQTINLNLSKQSVVVEAIPAFERDATGI